jgi:hypothetical protein
MPQGHGEQSDEEGRDGFAPVETLFQSNDELKMKN